MMQVLGGLFLIAMGAGEQRDGDNGKRFLP